MPRLLPGPQAATWVLVEASLTALMSLASVVVIGRIIGPAAVGLGTVAIAAFFLLELLPTSLWTEALVQRPRLTPRHASSAVTSAVLTGAACGLILAGLAPHLGDGTAAPLALALAPLLPVSAFTCSVTGLLLREQRFRLLAGRAMVGQPLALAAGVATGLAGHGPWALVVQQAVATAVALALVLGWGRLRLRPMLDLATLRDLAPVAGPQYAATVVDLSKYRALIVALSAILPAAAMAHAHVALRVVDGVVAPVAQIMARLALPRLCARQGDRPALVECYGRLVELQALLGLPAVVGVALVSPELVAVLLGPDWAGTADASAVAALGAVAPFLAGPHAALFIAVGRAGLNLRIALGTAAAQALALLALRPGSALEVALAMALAGAALAPVLAWLVLRELRRPPWWLLARLAPAGLACAAMALAVLLLRRGVPMAPVAAMLASMALGGLVYGLAAGALLGFRRPAGLRG